MSRIRQALVVVSCVALSLNWSVTVSAADATQIGQVVENFTLPDVHGKPQTLTALAGEKATVIAFVGTECPVALLYGPRLAELAAEFGPKGVKFIGIDSNRQDVPTEVAAYARRSGIEFPMLKDTNNAVADQFGAERTPEVFVLDSQRVIRYHGRIDDQYGLGATSGYAKPKVTRRDLACALDEIVNGEAVSVESTSALGCLIGRISKVDPHGDVTYSQQIARILQNRCVECHRPGELAPFSLTSYDEAVGWAEMMREVVDQGRMPPWFADPAHGKFANDARMSDDEKKALATWIDNGCPQGDPKDLPEPRQFATGWRIPEPDQVFYMEEAFKVPAEGVVDYQYFTVDPGFTEDKWIQAAEARPGNRAVVHHIIVMIEPKNAAAFPGGFRSRDGLTGYAPGMPPFVEPEGTATLVPAGAKLVFQMHYTPNGSEQEDRSYVGVKFADPKSVRKRIRGGMAPNFAFAIPPGADNHEVVSEYSFRRDTLLLSMTPHMHLRGKSFRYEAIYPDGTRETLLNVPNYDFNWQLRYELVEPRMLPKGTKLFCTAHFDNSEGNISNPDPKQEVRWGDQTWEEMMIGWFSTVDAHEDLQSGKSAKADAATENEAGQ